MTSERTLIRNRHGNAADLTDALAHGVPDGSPTGHDDRGFAVRLSGRPLGRSSLSPDALTVGLTPVYGDGHGDDQGHHGGRFARRTILLLGRKRKSNREIGEVEGKKQKGIEIFKKKKKEEELVSSPAKWLSL